MPAGKEMDALIAEHVMKWSPAPQSEMWITGKGDSTFLPNFSTDPTYLDELKERLKTRGWGFQEELCVENGYGADLLFRGRDTSVSPAPYVVLDKSFLIGVGRSKLEDLVQSYRFVATGSLLGESLQAFLPTKNKDDEQLERNVRSLRKFSDDKLALARIVDCGLLISVEARTHRPCWPIEDYLTSLIQFNPNYFGNSKRLRDEETSIVRGWSQFVEQNVDAAINCYENQGWVVLLEWDDTLKRLC